MFHLPVIFVLTFFISFAGSVHPGPVNVSVIQATLRRGLAAGLWLAVGGCVPEIIYGLLAVRGVRFFEEMPGVYRALQVAVVPVLALLGVFTLRRRAAAPSEASPLPARRQAFWKGLTLSLLSPQLLPFWVLILVYYNEYPWLRVRTGLEQSAFVAGTSLGGFALLYAYARLAHRRRDAIARYLRPERFDLVMGWGFLGMAVWRGLSLWVF